MRSRDRTILIIVLIVATLLAYGHLLSPSRMLYSRHSDIVAYHLGAKQVAFSAVQSGAALPFWRSDQLSGTPALTNPNSMFTYPLHLPFLFMAPTRAVGWVVLMHVAAAGVGFLLLGELLDLGRWPALVMGMAGVFNFKNIIALYAGWILPSLFLLPWIFLAVFGVCRRPGLRSGFFAALVAAVALHSGHLQLVYYSLFFLVGYVALEAAQRYRAGDTRACATTLAWLMLAGTLAAGVSAYLLVPMIGEASLVSRTSASYDFLEGGRRLGAVHLLTLIDPEAFGTPRLGTYRPTELWEDVGYFGIVPLLLAGVGAVKGYKDGQTKYFVACFVLSIVCALDTPVARLLYAAIPGYSLFRIPGRMLYMTAFFGIVLAGIGAHHLLRSSGAKPSQAVIVVLIAIAAIAGEGWFRVRRYLTTEPTSSVMPTADFAKLLRRDPEVFRTLTIPPTVNSGWSAAFGLQIVGGYDPYNFSPYGEFVSLMRTGRLGHPRGWVHANIDRVSRRDALDVLNVKYVLAPAPLNSQWPDLALVAHLPNQPAFVLYEGFRPTDVYVYRNLSYKPRAFLVERVVAAPASSVRHQLLGADLRKTAIIEGSPTESSDAGRPDEDVVAVEATSNGRLVVDTNTSARRFVVMSEVYHPGWQATLDDRPLPLVRTDHALLGAWIPPGRHRIDLLFRPVYWSASLAVSAVSGMALLAWAAVLIGRSAWGWR